MNIFAAGHKKYPHIHVTLRKRDEDMSEMVKGLLVVLRKSDGSIVTDSQNGTF
jgi:hypothetical protein